MSRNASATNPFSSLVENLNTRLRGYFFLEAANWALILCLPLFFFNHRPLESSHRPEREGKAPASSVPEPAIGPTTERTSTVEARGRSVLLPKKPRNGVSDAP